MQVLRPFLLRRLKESVAGELPTKLERLVRVPPAPYQRSLFGILGQQLAGGSGEGSGGSCGDWALGRWLPQDWILQRGCGWRCLRSRQCGGAG